MSPTRRLGPLHPDTSEPERLARTTLGAARQLELHRLMKVNRLLEDRVANLYRRGKLVGGAYSSRGQEGVSVGSAYALEPGDFIGPMIRNLGAQLVRGFTPREELLHRMGRAESPTGGKDNLPPTMLERGIVGPIAMLGASISVMAGVALAGRMQGKGLVAMTWIGDGGTSTGDFHESLNLAAVFDLPLVVVAEHNGWAYSTPTAKQMRIKDIAMRASAYGIPGEVVDGNDVLAVYEASRRAVERARRGGGPSLIEAKTFRMKGHAEHDDASYVPADLREHWEARDPIRRFERHLVDAGLATEEELAAVEAEIEAGLEADVEYALAAPLPAAEEAARGVYEAPVPEPAAGGGAAR